MWGSFRQGGLADVCVTENRSDHKCVVFQDKVVLPTTQGVGKGSDKDTMPFSLWRWLHSIINLLVETLKDPWLDGYVPNYTSMVHCGCDPFEGQQNRWHVSQAIIIRSDGMHYRP